MRVRQLLEEPLALYPKHLRTDIKQTYLKNKIMKETKNNMGAWGHIRAVCAYTSKKEAQDELMPCQIYQNSRYMKHIRQIDSLILAANSQMQKVACHAK